VPQTNAQYEPRTVAIRDARRVADVLSLDDEGVQLVEHKSAVRDFDDDDEVKRVYYPEAEKLVAAATGARWVLVFDHTVRKKIYGVADRTPGLPRQPARSVHNDYTERSGPQRVRDLTGEAAEALLRRRFAVINVWRPIRGPLYGSPLALCNANSTRAEDFVASDLMFRPVNELADMVRSGQVSARELVQASLDRIAELNPSLNAFVDVFAEDALAGFHALLCIAVFTKD